MSRMNEFSHTNVNCLVDCKFKTSFFKLIRTKNYLKYFQINAIAEEMGQSSNDRSNVPRAVLQPVLNQFKVQLASLPLAMVERRAN